MRVSTSAARTIEHMGGLDAYLRNAAASELPAELRRLKKQLPEVTSEMN